ncbi:MFS general substrate transporter [Pseudovirgaria hyperparasitica]|uniref:MFS general substrate transporter n=1 Tax=Pseudovirgaria hyperparasitica TaxID=470096 RepID=A0A6A6WL76_9PEZI|nr:MFS general substrate transporter [Pseudovirgaria hyperparasitica]KAF2762759.1 MFS general substrate transporter [Pseudovirgaria hyperparasitica]
MTSSSFEHVEVAPPDGKLNASEICVERIEEERRLVRKVDLYLLPTIWLMYLLSYMDRTNIGNAKIAGMEADLRLSSSQYSIMLVVFFVTYVCFEIPSNLVLAKTRPSVFLPVTMILWGIVTCCMAAATSYKHLIALRLIVGLLEAGFAPGVLMILSSWYKKNEMSKRFAAYISAAVLSGAFGGLLGGAITQGLDGAHGIEGWRWLFIVEGAATISWAIIAHFILLDFPSTTKKFSARERLLATERLQRDNVTATTGNSSPKVSSMQATVISLKNWRTWVLTLGYMVIVGSSTLSYFYPTLVEGLGYTSHMAQYMTVPIYAVAFVAVGFTGYFGDRITEYRGVVIASWLALSMVCSIVVCVVYDFTARYALLVIMAAGLWASNGLALSYAGSTFGPLQQEVRAVSLAFVNAMGNLAQIYGAYLFPSDDKPKYLMGFGVISGMCGFGVVVYTVAHVSFKRWPTTS